MPGRTGSFQEGKCSRKSKTIRTEKMTAAKPGKVRDRVRENDLPVIKASASVSVAPEHCWDWLGGSGEERVGSMGEELSGPTSTAAGKWDKKGTRH